MSRIRIIAIYSLVGPVIGALTVFAAFSLPVILQDIWNDPNNQFGQDRFDDTWKTLALTLVFGYMLGFLPALASGVAHIKILPYLRNYRFLCVGLICLAGVLVTGIEMLTIGILKDSEPSLLIAPLVAALVLSICMTKSSID